MMLLVGKLENKKWLSMGCRFILAVVFVTAALGKISDPQRFADQVAGFHIIPIVAVNVFAIILPWVELLAGLSLLVNSLARQAGLVLILLNSVFVIAVASAMMRGLDIECGCFTVSKAHDHVGWGIIGRDILFLAMCIPVLCVKERPLVVANA